MHDWKAIVKEKLSPLPLPNDRAEEVIEEIALQLESAYDEARREGASKEESLARAFAQTGDWEKLRSRVFRSVQGGLLPVWQQRGVFSPRRFAVWIALLIALAFLALPGFRQVVMMLPVPAGKLESSVGNRVLSDAELSRLERAGDKHREARALAYVALHTDNNRRAVVAAEKAIALDPHLTWIAAPFSHALEPLPGRDPKPWIQRLESWDSGNAYPYMLEASSLIAAKRKSNIWKRGFAEFRNTLAADSAWRSAMDKASHATRVDFYFDREFALDKDVLEYEGCNRPQVLLAAVFEAPFPDVIQINAYLHVLLDEAHAADRAGDTSQALEKYWRVINFGERLNAASQFPLVYPPYRRDAFTSMLPLLVKAGAVRAAHGVRAVISSDDTSAERVVQEYKAGERASGHSADMVFASALCFEFLVLATVLWLFLAAILKWKPSLSRDLNWLASLLCYAPPALAAASFALFLTYFPYARPLGAITSRRELVTTYVPLLARFSTFVANPAADTWITRMFWPSLGCVAIAISGAFLLRWRQHHGAMQSFR